jgi:hypothetical protein
MARKAGFKALGRAIKKHVAEGRKGQITGDDIMAQTDSARKAKAKPAQKPAVTKAKALKMVNPSSGARKSTVMKTVKRPTRSNKKRSKGAGIQT